MRGVTRTGIADGPSVVFLHGGVINRHMWIPVTKHLEDRFHTISIDLPQHGDRQEERFSIDGSIALISEVMDHLAIESASLVGLSLGGYVAQAFAGEHPDRVNGLVLSGSTVCYTGWDGFTARLYGYVLPLTSRPAKKAFAGQIRKLEPEAAEPMLECGISMRAGGRAMRVLPGRDYASALSFFEGPIVVANGERDEGNRKYEKQFLSHVPTASVITIEDAGHACALTQPAAFAAAVEQLMSEVP